ncbi:MAG: AAA family ATPase, partial [Solirubrobacteraceae bacterium]
YEDGIVPTAEAVARLLTLLRRKFNHIVVDLPSPPPPSMRQVLTVARQRVVVLGPDITSLRDTLAARRLCTRLGVPRVITVLNRAGGAGALKPALITEGLGAAPDVMIPDLSHHLPRAANLGKVALPKVGALRRALEPLTLEVSGVRVGAASRSGKSLLSWLSRS